MSYNHDTDPRTTRSLTAYRKALTELLQDKSLEEITVTELSAKAGYHRSTFYRHYNHVAELFDEVQAEMLDQFEAIMSRYPVQGEAHAGILGRDARTTIQILDETFTMIKENASFASVLLANPMESQLLHSILETGRTYTVKQWPHALPSHDVDYYDRYYTFITGGFIATIQRWLTEGMQFSTRELAQLCYDFITLGTHNKRNKR